MYIPLEQSIDVLKLATDLVGLTYNVQINSGVFEHCNGIIDEKLDVTKDIYEIKASLDDPITINKILNIFVEIDNQLAATIEHSGRSFFYEGILKHNNMWEISWGS